MIFWVVEWIRGWLTPYPFWEKNLGRKGEYLARRYWRRRGYHLIHANWRYGRGEIDAIMANGNKVVFLEVKSRTRKKGMRIGDQLSYDQKQRLLRLARNWLAQWDEQLPWSFNLMLIKFEGNKYEIQMADVG